MTRTLILTCLAALLLATPASSQWAETHSLPPDVLALLATAEPERRPAAHGKPYRGGLDHAEQLPPHPAYRIRDPERAYGTPETIATLTEAFDRFHAEDPTAPAVMIHDISLPKGGPMPGHRSHQTGRDVDITYFRKDCDDVCRMQPVTPETLDAPRQWRLLRALLQSGRVRFIFIDYAVQAALFEAAQAAGEEEADLASWFQYPAGSDAKLGSVRHVSKHADHLHVRIRDGLRDNHAAWFRLHRHSAR